MTIKDIFKDKTLYKLILIVIGIHCLIYGFLLFTNHSLTFYGDQTQQVIQFYTNIYTNIHEGTYSFWNHSISLGSPNSISLFTLLGDPLSYLIMFVPDVSFIPYGVTLISILRNVILVILAYGYFKRIGINQRNALIIGSLLFSCNSFSQFFINFPYLANFMIYTLLLMITSENVLNNKSCLPFILTIALTSISNLYNIYMNCWFLVIYLTIRLFIKEDNLTLKKYINYFMRFFIYIVLGIGISALVFIPNVISVLTNPRVGNGEFTLVGNLYDLFARLSQLISPIANDYDYNVYINALNPNLSTPIPYFFISILFIYSLFLSFNCKFKAKNPLFIGMGALFIASLFPLTNYIFNGSNDIRWSYYFCVLAILFITYVMNEPIQLNTGLKPLIYSCGYILVIFLISFFADLNSERNILNLLLNTVIMIIFVIFYALSTKYNKQLFLIATCIFEVTYIFTFRYINFAGYETLSNYDYQQIIYDLNDSIMLDVIRQEDTSDDFYRIDIQKNNSSNYNDALMHHYNGFNSYQSVTNFFVAPYTQAHFSNDHFINSDGTKTLAKQLAGMRYCANSAYPMIGGDLSLISDQKGFIYKVNNPVNLGFALTNKLSLNYANALPLFYQDYLSQYYALTSNSDNEIVEPKFTLPQSLITQENNHLKIESNYNYLVVDYSLTNQDSQVTVEFYNENNESIHYQVNNEHSYTVFKIPEQATSCYIYVVNQYNLNESIDSVAFLLEDYTLDDSQFVASFDQQKMSKDRLDATISLTKDATIITTIAYHPNWHVSANNQSIQTYRVNNGFIGFDLPQGTYTITIQYQPNWIFPLSITLICLCGALYISRKKIHKPN